MHILYIAGGTGGTLTPLLAIAEALRAERPQLVQHCIISPNDAERLLLRTAALPWTEFQSGKLRRYWSWKNVRDALTLPFQVLRAWRWLRRRRPRLVITAGSYNGVPFGWAARALGITLLVHQQDVQPGLANRLIAASAQQITVMFEASIRHFGSRARVAWTGNPVRRAMLQGDGDALRRTFGIPLERPLLLILGGSTGALFLNRLVADSLPTLTQWCHVLHVTGAAQRAQVLPQNGYTPVPFLTEQLGNALVAADLVVSRAGSATLSELAVLGKPTIVIPMQGTQQEANAALFAQYHAAIVLNQREQTPATFTRAVESLLRDDAHRQLLGRTMQQMNRHDATERLKRIILQLLDQRA